MVSPTQLTLVVVIVCAHSGLPHRHHHHHRHHHRHDGDWTNLKRAHENANSPEELDLLEDSVVCHQSLYELKRRFGDRDPVLRRTGRGFLQWAVKAAMILPAKIGKTVVSIPRTVEKTVQSVTALKRIGTALKAKILSDAADWFQGNWEAVKTIEFPGKQILVMMFPGMRVMSVVDRLSKEIMYITNKGGQAIHQAFAYTIYASLRLVFAGVTSMINKARLDCVKLKPQSIKITNVLVSNIYSETGYACGITHLKPMNNVTIMRNDDKFLIVNTPWVLNGISVDLGSVKVDGLGETLLDNEPMTTTVDKVLATGTVSFESGTLLRFVRIHIEVNKIIGLNVTFKSPQKSSLMEAIEGMADAVSGIVTQQVNDVLKKMEDKVFDYIAKI